jgi:hypothetical protein
MNKIQRLDELSKEEKIAFFQKCQDLLMKNQPGSEFVLRTASAHNKNYFLDLFLKYKGLAYSSERLAVLFNKRKYTSLAEAQESYWKDLFDPPHKNPRCYTVDFITTKLNKSLLAEIDPIADEDLDYVCFLRASKVSFFKKKDFRESLFEKFTE